MSLVDIEEKTIQQAEAQSIKRRQDGSIDTAYYLEMGRKLRSEQAHILVKAALPKKTTLSVRLWFRESIWVR